MSYAVYFSIKAIGRSVDAASPESCAGPDTVFELLASLSSEGDFFGLIDTADSCLQVRFEDAQNRYWLEVSRPDLGGAYGAHYSFDEAAKVLAELPERLPKTGLPGFEFYAWH